MKYSNTLKLVFSVAFTVLISACSSNHNIKEDGTSLFGGGFSDEMIMPGFYKMYALSNRGLIVTSGAAEKTWKNRAEQLCGIEGYKEFMTDGYISSQGPVPIYLHQVGMLYLNEYQSSKNGYIVCNNAKITVEEAKNHILKKQQEFKEKLAEHRKAYIASMKHKNCDSDFKSDPDASNYLVGKEIYKARMFKEAKLCFEKAVNSSTNDAEIKDSYFHIGMMHELGQGVTADINKAKSYYSKAGLLDD